MILNFSSPTKHNNKHKYVFTSCYYCSIGKKDGHLALSILTTSQSKSSINCSLDLKNFIPANLRNSSKILINDQDCSLRKQPITTPERARPESHVTMQGRLFLSTIISSALITSSSEIKLPSDANKWGDSACISTNLTLFSLSICRSSGSKLSGLSVI